MDCQLSLWKNSEYLYRWKFLWAAISCAQGSIRICVGPLLFVYIDDVSQTYPFQWQSTSETKFTSIHVVVTVLNIRKVIRRAHLPKHPEDEDVHHTYKTRGKKTQLVYSLAQALTLTLTLNHLANKPQRTASKLFSTTDYKYFNKCAAMDHLWIFNKMT